MNTLVSYDWLKEYVDLNGVTPDEFARRVSLSGPGIEKIYPQGADLDKIVIGHVLEVKPHPNADKLRIATVDVGAAGSSSAGKKNKTVSIVCGGSNLKEDQWVVVSLIGAKVRWHGEGDLITLESIEIRGVKSEGMICASNEIGLGDAFPAAEREIVDLGVVLPEMKLKTGTPLADALGLSSDSVMDIEVTSNRVDAMGMVGMAREAATILKKPFLYKPTKLKAAKASKTSGISTKISAKKQCARYMAARIDGISMTQSPWWLKRRLLSAGLRPINLLVDISNYVMLELAQPTHVFDAALLHGGLDVRLARVGEKMKALDGKEYRLDDSILVIADAKKPVAIAGVMGGEETGVSLTTKSVVIEVANFDAVTIRRGARKLNLQSDAQARFEKGLSTEACPEALARMIELILELAGGTLMGVTDVCPLKYKQLSYSITVDEVNSLIGVELPRKEMLDILKRLGFSVVLTGKKITAKVPWWRDHDIESGRDFVEEIARVYGYGNIPGIVPVGLAPRAKDKELTYEKHARCISKGAGLTELYTYSFVSKDLMAKASFDGSRMLAVQNPLNAEFEVMRTTLLPSILQVASDNRERFGEQRLFEIANVYYVNADAPAALPDEQLMLSALFMGMPNAWRVAKGYVEHLFVEMGCKNLSWRRLTNDSFWHPGRAVQAFVDGQLVATLGEVSPKIAQNFKLERVALVDIPFEKVLPFLSNGASYQPLSVFPEAKRDLAVVVDHRSEYDDIARAARRVDPLVTDVEWFDTYRGKNLPEGKKSVAMHVTFSSNERTLESAEVDALMERIVLRLKEEFEAEVRM